MYCFMAKINVSKSELVNAFTKSVTNSTIVRPHCLQWICPYRNSYGEKVYCIIRLEFGGTLYGLSYKTLRCMSNLLNEREPYVYIFTVRYSSNLDKCYLLIDKE